MTILPSDVDPLDDDPSEDLSPIDITQNYPGFSVGSQQESSFSTPVESMLVESYRDKLKKMYRINDETFNELIPNLRMIDNKLYYEGRDRHGNPVNILIEDKSGGVYTLSTIESKRGGTSFIRTIETFELSQRSKRPTVQEQPIKPTVVDRQTISYDNLAIEQAEQLIQPTVQEQPVEPTIADI